MARSNANVSYRSSNPEIADVDASGMVAGRRAGFSTLTATAGNVVATATITVVQIAASTDVTEIAGVVQDLSQRLFLAASLNHTILTADSLPARSRSRSIRLRHRPAFRLRSAKPSLAA